MRIHLKFKISNQTVPFDHQPLLVGAIHKWLGQNEEHGEISLYSFSRLEGGKATEIVFENQLKRKLFGEVLLNTYYNSIFVSPI